MFLVEIFFLIYLQFLNNFYKLFKMKKKNDDSKIYGFMHEN